MYLYIYVFFPLGRLGRFAFQTCNVESSEWVTKDRWKVSRGAMAMCENLWAQLKSVLFTWRGSNDLTVNRGRPNNMIWHLLICLNYSTYCTTCHCLLALSISLHVIMPLNHRCSRHALIQGLPLFVLVVVAYCCEAPAPQISPSKVQAALSKFDLANDVRMNAKVGWICFGRFCRVPPMNYGIT